MLSKAFENEFLKNLGKLTREEQNKVLAYAKSLLNHNRSRQGLLLFAGSLDSVSIREISEAVESGCEDIDKNEW